MEHLCSKLEGNIRFFTDIAKNIAINQNWKPILCFNDNYIFTNISLPNKPILRQKAAKILRWDIVD